MDEIREGLEKEIMLALWDRAQVLLWLKRASRYFPFIESELKRRNLPEDLKYIPVVESALRPHAGSHKGAVGYWQFITSTARKYGLRVDGCLDERRHLEKSTRAACDYLSDLYEQFDHSWALAFAAYNMGENGLAAAIRIQGENDYYHLYLSLETMRYVLKILAVKIIFTEPEKFGFVLEPNDRWQAVNSDTVTFKSPGRLDLLVVARAARTTFKKLKLLNPDLRGSFLCRETYRISVPKGQGDGFQDRLKPILSDWLSEHQKQLHTVQKGENLTMIARKYDISLGRLLQWNGLTLKSFIHPGDVLVVGRGGTL